MLATAGQVLPEAGPELRYQSFIKESLLGEPSKRGHAGQGKGEAKQSCSSGWILRLILSPECEFCLRVCPTWKQRAGLVHTSAHSGLGPGNRLLLGFYGLPMYERGSSGAQMISELQIQVSSGNA